MRLLSLPLYALAPLAVACSAPVVLPGSGVDSLGHDATDGVASAGLVVIERTVTADDAARSSAVARFIKMRAGSLDDETLRMVGATLDLPPLGACAPATAGGADTTLSGASATREAEGPRAVELLDVGGVAIEANSLRTTLEARALPDIVDLVTGVLYSTRLGQHDPDALPGQGAYVIRSSGSSSAAEPERGVPAFTVSATAPGEPDDLRVDGQDARSSDGVRLTAGGLVALSWRANDAADPDDVIYVDLIPARGAGGSTEPGQTAATVRCLFADRGAATLPASAFTLGAPIETHGTTSPEPLRSEVTRGTLVVHRVHREAFQVPGRPATPQAAGRTGIDSGVVRFDLARAAEFTRR